MNRDARVVRRVFTQLGAAFLGAVCGVLLLASLLGGRATCATSFHAEGTGSDPRIGGITVTADLPVRDAHPGDGVSKDVYYRNSAAGLLTLTFRITGTPVLSLTAGAAFGEPTRTYTSSTAPWTPTVTYTVGTDPWGRQTVTYSVVNTNGVSVTVVITYVRDVTGPQTAIIAPPGTGFVTGTHVVIQGTAQDDGAGVRSVQVTTGTTWHTATGTANWAYTWTLPSGEDGVTYTLRVYALDALGNAGAEATRVVTVDTAVPPPVTAPVDEGAWSPTSTVVFTWSPVSDGSGRAGYAVLVTSTGGFSSVFSASTTVLTFTQADNEGATYYARARARDRAGNWGTYGPASDGIAPDLTPPIVTCNPVQPASPSVFYALGSTVYYTNETGGSKYFNLLGLAEDTLSGEGTVVATPALGTSNPTNVGNWASWEFGYRVPSGATESGHITVTVSDAVGHATYCVYTYTHDGFAPTGAITIAGGTEYVTQSTVLLSLSATDNLTGSGVAEMCIGAEPTTCMNWEPFASTRSWELTGGDGVYTLYVRYRDHLGNASGVFSDKVFKDRVPPVVTVTAPSWTAQTAFTVSWSASDPKPGSGLVPTFTVEYREDEGSWKTWLASTSLTESLFVSATLGHTYEFRVTARDRAGNEGVGTARTRVDYFRIFLPLTVKGWVWWYQYDPYEPNDTPDQAYGPLVSGQVYEAYIWDATDSSDYYFIKPTTKAEIVVTLSNIPAGCDYDLYVYYKEGDTYQLVARSDRYGNVDEEARFTPTPGIRYYIRVYPYEGASNQQRYRLRAVYQ